MIMIETCKCIDEKYKCSGKCKRIQLSVMGKCIAMASASVLSCVESARQNIVSFIGLFCKRDLSFY